MAMSIEITIGSNLKRWYLLDDEIISKFGVTKMRYIQHWVYNQRNPNKYRHKNIKEKCFFLKKTSNIKLKNRFAFLFSGQDAILSD